MVKSRSLTPSLFDSTIHSTYIYLLTRRRATHAIHLKKFELYCVQIYCVRIYAHMYIYSENLYGACTVAQKANSLPVAPTSTMGTSCES